MPNTIKYIRPKKKTGLLLFLAKLNFASKLSIFASLVLVLAGTFGLLFLRDSFDQSQDIRQQASVGDGTVEITFRLRDTASNTLKKGKNYVDFYVDTKSLQTDGIQLVFDVLTGAPGYSYQVDQVISETPDFQVEAETGLQTAYQEIEKIGSGYSVATILLPAQISGTFSTANPTKFATLVIDYTGEEKMNGGILVPAAPITLGFIGERSIVTAHASNPPKDVLKPIALSVFQGVDGSDLTGSDLIGDDMCAMSGIGCSDQDNSDQDDTQATSSSAQASTQSGTTTTSTNQNNEEKTTSTGTGGTSASTSTNTSTSTSTSTSNNTSINSTTSNSTRSNSTNNNYTTTSSATASCNQVCANNHSCAAGLTCYASRCRNPLNLENTNCALPSSETLGTIAQRCNQTCASHRDCPANMLCHSQSTTCRLATNPGSLTCTPSTTPTISGINAPKGGLATESASLGQSATMSAGLNQNKNPFGSYANTTDEPIKITDDTQDSTTSDRFEFITTPLSSFSNSVQSILGRIFPGIQTIFVWIGAIIFGIVLLLLSILFAVFTRRKNGTAMVMKKVDPETRAAQELAQKQLQERISALQTSDVAVFTASPFSPVAPVVPVSPVVPVAPITLAPTPVFSTTPAKPVITPVISVASAVAPTPASPVKIQAVPVQLSRPQTVQTLPIKPQGVQSQTVFQSNPSNQSNSSNPSTTKSSHLTGQTPAPTSTTASAQGAPTAVAPTTAPSSTSSMLERIRNKGVTPPHVGQNLVVNNQQPIVAQTSAQSPIKQTIQSPIQDTKDS